MARTTEDVLKDILASQLIKIAELTAKVEQLEENFKMQEEIRKSIENDIKNLQNT